MAESVDLDMRLQQLVRAGLMPSNTIPLLRKAITKIQGGYPLQGAERDIMANFLNSMMFIVLGDDSIFNKARVGAKTYATEAKEKTEYDYEGDMAMSQLKSIIANSQRMHDMLSDDTNLPEWVQSKITLAEDYISTASNYMQGEMNEEKMPFKGPYKKAGERKDKYGNTVKNVPQYLAKKAMNAQKNEEAEPVEEKRGLWDNIHAKRKRIKAGSGERMRKPGSEGAPSAADLKSARNEEVDLEEATYFVHTANNAHHVNKKIPTGKKDAMGQALMTSKVVKSFPYGDTQSKQTSPDQHKAAHAHAKKLNAGMKEEVESIDELSNKTLNNYKDKAWREKRDADKNDDIPHYNKRMKGYISALRADQRNFERIHGNLVNGKFTKEEVEQVDEISSDMAYRFLKGKRERDYDISADGKSSKLKKPMTYAKMNKDAKSSIRALRTIQKAKKANEEKESRRGEARADIAAITQMNESYKTTFNAALTQYGIKSPSELDEEKRKQFFNFVDQEYKKGDN
jgi:hypothetical protein